MRIDRGWTPCPSRHACSLLAAGHSARPDGRNVDFCGFESHLTSMAQAAISVRRSRPWQSAAGDRGRPPSATSRSTRQPISQAEGGVNLLSKWRGSQVLLERLSLATKVSQVGQTPSMHCGFSQGDRDPLVSCQHHTHSSALALTAGDEQMTV